MPGRHWYAAAGGSSLLPALCRNTAADFFTNTCGWKELCFEESSAAAHFNDDIANK